MAANPRTLPTPKPRQRWAVWSAVAIVGLGAAGALFAFAGHGAGTSSSTVLDASDAPSATWPAGAQRAPSFRLTDQNGKPFSLASLRGRNVIVAFIDPLCQDFCPIEAQRLSDAVSSLPASSRPTIVAVSVNPLGNARATLLSDAHKWRVPPQWRWGVGDEAQLARVWQRFHIAVLPTTTKVNGVIKHDVAHTEASYVVDAAGYERALFLWPYRGDAVARVLRSLG